MSEPEVCEWKKHKDKTRDKTMNQQENSHRVRVAEGWEAGPRQVVQQTAGRTIRRVYRADEAPRLWKQLTDRCGLHLGEESTAVNAAEVRQVTQEVELVCNDGETSDL